MVNSFQSTFQSSHDNRELGFKGPRSTIPDEQFANLNVHDLYFDIDDIGLYFSPYSLVPFDYSIPFDFFDPPLSLSMVIYVNMIFIHEIDPFYHPLDDDSFIDISLESTNFFLSVSFHHMMVIFHLNYL